MYKHQRVMTRIVFLMHQIIKPKAVKEDCCSEISKDSNEKVVINKNRSGTMCYNCEGFGRIFEPSYGSFESVGGFSGSYGGLISSPKNMLCPICEGTGYLISS
jgi:hypothetical protein